MGNSEHMKTSFYNFPVRLYISCGIHFHVASALKQVYSSQGALQSGPCCKLRSLCSRIDASVWSYCGRKSLGRTWALLQLHKRLITQTCFHQKVTAKWSRADIRCTRRRMVWFFVSTEILGLRRFGDRTNPPICTDRQRAAPGQVWIMDNFWKQQL